MGAVKLVEIVELREKELKSMIVMALSASRVKDDEKIREKREE